jgi:hypothetical protein
MGFAADQLRDKALLALEEALADMRAKRPRRSIALRFALAYLWTISRGERSPFDSFWRDLERREPWSYGCAEAALRHIYHVLGVQRDEDLPGTLLHRPSGPASNPRAD